MANVLVIDDDHDVTHLLRTYLIEQGHEVSVAHHGEEGLDHAAKMAPDLILLDLYLPDSTGYQICNQFRSATATQSVPIIMMTGATQFPAQSFGDDKGANEYIFKPFDVEQVAGLVRKYVGTKAAPMPPLPLPAFKLPAPADDLETLGAFWKEFAEPSKRAAPFIPPDVTASPIPIASSKPAIQISHGYGELMGNAPGPTPAPTVPEKKTLPPLSVVPLSLISRKPIPVPPAPVMADVPEPLPVAPDFVPGTPAFADRLMEFGLEVYDLAGRLCRTHAEEYLAAQLLRSSLAVGARIQESRSSESRAHFLALVHGALKDMRETAYWLSLAQRAGLLEARGKMELVAGCQTLITLLENFVSQEKKRLLPS